MAYLQKLTGAQPIKLRDFDPEFDAGLNKQQGEEKLQKLSGELTRLQELLYAAGQHSVLIVLQGRDTSGKDGTIKAVMGPLNSLGCQVASFKVPTEKELAHDFLWRIHQQTPGKGEITIFNRSHYEDVLVVRVHKIVPDKVWRSRYVHINDFEKLLTESGVIVLKFYLHISKDEQEKRLLERAENPEKYWKLSAGDWKEREYWNDYTRAYEDALNQCSTPHAPWFVVPANKKWFRNLAIAEAIVNALKPYEKQWRKHLESIGQAEKARIDEYRSTWSGG
ncbi:MAG TPA: polyphosphate kinase 2 family protein [Blastocatellia bacterium]|nr:polyphosphate kinase 2 family protein [Blastocatellia bacterium]HMV83856.1 polyphosphate kinase 2 family protein [Blastocatellia bacterium]HMX27320.1 polyphosphate kinase 2 family protein [Blastocatellia bacterium]HMY73479.1 polyphosphate kinase 2 family protein [Blastocatellia bacterium]HMZ21258.1 polyphosphate kinase 2 family protein [Blastocatellia bacterium]